MNNMLDSLVVFVNHLDELIGVFDSGYNGGDFCSGMIFASAGSNLIQKIAETIVSHAVSSVEKPKKNEDNSDKKNSTKKSKKKTTYY
jgi:hypothetical protein